MLKLPPIPSWDGLHPLLVHFPIALLLTAPVLIVAALIVRPLRGGIAVAALILMVLGTAGAYLAVETGEAAAKVADRTPEINQMIERHEHMAETTRLLFTILTTIWLALLAGGRFLGNKIPVRVQMAIAIVFVAGYGFASLSVANTAHLGGRLVHELGVKAEILP